MEVYLVRHTTPDIEKGICYGQSDLGLADSWKKEFEQVISKLPLKQPIKIFSSPLKRCALLAEHLGKNIWFDNRLRELDFGDWELKTWNDIPNEELNAWMTDFVNVQVPNGESYKQLATRVHGAFVDLITPKDCEKVIIVTHAGPIRALLSRFQNIPLEDSFQIKINYGQVFHLYKENDKFELKSH